MLHHITAGQGKQIIFIHGNSQSCKVWQDVFENGNLWKNYKLIAVDLPGHGNSFRSVSPEEDYSLKALAEHLLKFLEEFDAEPYVLVGNSLGSNVIGEAALQLKNCKGIMITGSCLLGKGLSMEDAFLPNPNSVACFISNPSEAQTQALVDDTVFNAPAHKKELIKNEYNNTDKNFRSSVALSFVPGVYSDELQNLEDSEIPLAFVFGAHEKFCNINYLDKIILNKWKNSVISLEHSGHFSHIDQPEKMAEVIGEFADDCFR